MGVFSSFRAASSATRAANNTVALLGDSRPHRVDFSSQWINGNGFAAWQRRRLFGQMDFNKANNFAVGNYSTQDVIDHTLTPCANSSAGSVLILVGINDIDDPGATLAQTNANLDTIVSTLHAAGKVVFIVDELPTNDVAGSPTAIYHVGIRDHIRATFNRPDLNEYVLPGWNSIAVTPNSLDAVPGSYPDDDSPHPTSVAGNSIADASVPIMSPVLPTVDLYNRPGLLAGGNLTTSGGSLTGGATGTAASGWTVNINGGAGTAAVCSVVAEDGLNWQQVAVSGGTGSDVTAFTGNLISGFTPGTSYIDMLMRVRVVAGSAGINRLRLVSLRNGGTAIPCANGDPAYDAGSIVTDLVPSVATDMLFWLPHVLVPADATSFNQRLEIKANTGVAANITVKFAIPQLRIYTGSLTD